MGKPEILNTFNIYRSKTSIRHKKSIKCIKLFVIIIKFFLLKNTFKVTLKYLNNVFKLFNTVSYIKLNFKLKIDPEICSFKNLEEFLKT